MAFNFFNYIITMLVAGFGSFGGGIGAVNIMKDFAVNCNWIEDELEFLNMATISQYNGYSQGMMMATYLGIRTELGIIGGILGVIAFIMPSVLIIAILIKIGEKFYKNSVFMYSMKYINLFAAGLLCMIFWNYIVLIFNLDPIIYVAVAGLACFFSIYFNLSPAVVIAAGGLIGLIWSGWRRWCWILRWWRRLAGI